MIVQRLTQDKSLSIELTDASLAAQSLTKSFGRSILKMLKNTDHGKYLIEIGFLNDIKVCAEVDSTPILPMLIGTSIKLRKDGTVPADKDAAKSVA